MSPDESKTWGGLVGRLAAEPGRWGMAALLLVVLSMVAAGWRYFPGFAGDHAWYLQVALRASQGETLYRDAAWAYGPLPAQALAALFRWGGPDAAWASLVNGLLTLAGVLLTYAVARSLLAPGGALLVTAFAALAGPNLWGGLFHTLYYVYTQAVTWGSVASLAALAAALRWLHTGRARWLLLAGLAAGLAILTKPEFGLTALAAGAAALAAGRGPARAWASYLLAAGLTAAAGFGPQAWSAGLAPLVRGYSGYNQLVDRSSWLWGIHLGQTQYLLGGYALWLAVLAIWASRRWPRRRRLALAMAGAAGLAALLAALSLVLDGEGSALAALLGRGGAPQVGWQPLNLLHLTALPWSPLLPLLLLAGWTARRRGLPAAWWAVWTYAAVSSLRLVLTGYASPFAVAPALAVFWVWIEDRIPAGSPTLARARAGAVTALVALAAFNLAGQVIVPSFLFSGPRAAVDTALGTVYMPQRYQAEFTAVTEFVERNAPPGAPLFSAGFSPHWYLLTGRPNPTAFDLLITGLGSSGPEARQVERDLLADPPAVVILPRWWDLGGDELARDAEVARQNMPGWWQALREEYQEQPLPAAPSWRVLLRTATP